MKKLLRKIGFKFWERPENIVSLPAGDYKIIYHGISTARRYETTEDFDSDYGSWSIVGTHEGACCTNDIDYIKI